MRWVFIPYQSNSIRFFIQLAGWYAELPAIPFEHGMTTFNNPLSNPSTTTAYLKIGTPHDWPYRIIRLKDVLKITGLSRSTVYDLMSTRSPRYDATFPRSISLTPGTVGWVDREIYQWLEVRISQRSAS